VLDVRGEARRAAAAGAQAIVAQGMEGGGHVWHTATMPLVPQISDAVPDLPLLAAGGIADGRGMAAAMMLGADGVLLHARRSMMSARHGRKGRLQCQLTSLFARKSSMLRE
jgi:isopentenyl diphosphate isomerase/L-lactate dehydrogenase-like FMN-dependent dehydrogenase